MGSGKLLLTLLLPLAFAPSSAPAQTGSISGHVFCADTQTPCRFAAVTMQSAPAAAGSGRVGAPTASQTTSQTSAPTGAAYSATTDLDGAFQIGNVQPGSYYLLARAPGYISPSDLVASEYPEGSALRTEALDAALARVAVDVNQAAVANLTLARGAVLSGTVRFDDGGTAGSIAVHLFRRNAAGKWMPFSSLGGNSRVSSLGFAARTDDRGRFYEPGLPPGAYTVSVSLPEIQLLSNGINGRQTLNVRISSGDALQIFLGNVFRLHEAAATDLREGETRDGLEITIPTSGLHTLRGTLSSLASLNGGDRGLHGSVRLLDPDDRTPLRETAVQGDGQFTFRYVATGSYLIEIDAQGSGRGSPRLAPLSSPLRVDGSRADLSYTLQPAKP